MTRGKTNSKVDSRTAQQAITTAVGAADALIGGVANLAKRAIVETVHAAESVGTEIGATLSRAAGSSIKVAGPTGGDVGRAGRPASRGITEAKREVGTTGDGRQRKAPARARGDRRRRAGS